MLRNIIYRDGNCEVILVAHHTPTASTLTVYVYRGHATGTRTQVAVLRCEFTKAMTELLMRGLIATCWKVVNEYGSVASEIIASVDSAIRKELLSGSYKFREIDWTKQVPTELGSGDTA